MAQPSGVLTKIDRLHQAADLATDLLATAGANENPGSYQLGDIEIESSGGVVVRHEREGAR